MQAWPPIATEGRIFHDDLFLDKREFMLWHKIVLNYSQLFSYYE